jgi:hypothetical protein
VRIPRVAIGASELASAVWIDRPPKRHPGAGASIQNPMHRHLDELDPSGRLIRDQAIRAEWQCSDGVHLDTFAFSSLIVKF